MARRLSVEQCRTRNRVSTAQIRVDVTLDARISILVQGRASGARSLSTAATGDLDVETLGVVLRAVQVTRRVKGDDLVAKDVVSGGIGGRNGHCGRVVVGDHFIISPNTRWVGAVDQALSGDLDKLQGGLVHGGTVAVAWSEVSNQLCYVSLSGHNMFSSLRRRTGPW